MARVSATAVRAQAEAGTEVEALVAAWKGRDVKASRYQLRGSSVGNSKVTSNRKQLKGLRAQYGGEIHEIATFVSVYSTHESLAVDCPKCGAAGQLVDAEGKVTAPGSMCHAGPKSSTKPCRPHLARIYAHSPVQHPLVQKHPALRVACPDCSAAMYSMCVTEKGKRAKEPHAERSTAYGAELAKADAERERQRTELGAALSAVAADGGKRTRKA